MYITGSPQVSKWSGEKIIQCQGKVREVYFESGKIYVLKKRQGKLKNINPVDLLALKSGTNIWGNCYLNDIFL